MQQKWNKQKTAKSIKIITKQKTDILKTKIDTLQMTLETNQHYSIALASGIGASIWLTAIPLKRYGSDLTKTEFRDNLSVTYGLQLETLPFNLPCCEDFSLTRTQLWQRRL